MLLVIVDRVWNERAGRAEEQVSHGIDLETDRVITLPNGPPWMIGAKFDIDIGEYTLETE
jgi:hypothetical protein